MLLAGSIGLGPLASRHRWTALSIDVYPEAIGAFRVEDAGRLLLDLSAMSRLGLSPEVATAVVERMGWPIACFLQLFVGALRDLDLPAVDLDTAERAVRRRALSEVLEHDGYRLHREGQWCVRSPLLREAWLMREAR